MVDLDRLERALIAAARERRPVTYGQLLAFFDRKVTPVNVGALCRDLGIVCRSVVAKGGPDLACLVVRKSDGMPGDGYFTGDDIPAGADPWLLVADRQEAAYDWAEGQPA